MKPRIFYMPEVRSDTVKPEVAIAAARLSDKVVNVSLSVCSKKDAFNKAKGRAIAVQRLNTDHSFDIDIEDRLSYAGLIQNYLEEINTRHPGTISDQTFFDIDNLIYVIHEVVKA